MHTYTCTHEDLQVRVLIIMMMMTRESLSEIKGILDIVYTKIKQVISQKCCLAVSILLMEYRICERQAL